MKAIITFQGFTEDADRPSGTENLFFHVIRKFAGPNVTTYHPKTWKCDLDKLVSQLIRQGVRDVAIVGYSWGGGYTAVKAAAMLAEWNIRVGLMLLCDPVYRPRWMPAWMGANPLCFRSMLPGKKISIPSNVRRVAWVRQTMTRPAGHDLKAERPHLTHIEPATILPFSHVVIDEAPQWYETVNHELQAWKIAP